MPESGVSGVTVLMQSAVIVSRLSELSFGRKPGSGAIEPID